MRLLLVDLFWKVCDDRRHSLHVLAIDDTRRWRSRDLSIFMLLSWSCESIRSSYRLWVRRPLSSVGIRGGLVGLWLRFWIKRLNGMRRCDILTFPIVDVGRWVIIQLLPAWSHFHTPWFLSSTAASNTGTAGTRNSRRRRRPDTGRRIKEIIIVPVEC